MKLSENIQALLHTGFAILSDAITERVIVTDDTSFTAFLRAFNTLDMSSFH